MIPSLSVATTVIVFSPSESVSGLLHVSVPAAFSPFTVTLAIPEPSEAVPETVISDILTVEPSTGDIIVITGAVVSSVTEMLKGPFCTPPDVAVSAPCAGIEQLIPFIFHVNTSPSSAPSSSAVPCSSKIMSNE